MFKFIIFVIMEENKKVKYKGIKFDSLIKLEISGTFAGRLQMLLMYILQQKNVSEITKVVNDLKTREPQNDFEFHVLTMIILIQDLEKAAAEQNLIVDQEVDPSSITEN